MPKSLAIVWAQYGPYHFARAAALQKLAEPAKIHAIELANRTNDYDWNRSVRNVELITLCPGEVAEQLSFRNVFQRSRRMFAKLKIQVCLLPGYSPKQSLAALLAAKSLGIQTVMMNESHAGTARAGGVSASVKSRLVGLFDAALVGGHPQRRYFASLGMPEKKMLIGYDAVDNDYFATRSEEIRNQQVEIRKRYHLPEHYFLSLGRFISKKNLGTLLRAYRKVLDLRPHSQTHLVMVGSGEEENRLQVLCNELRLPIYAKSPGVTQHPFSKIKEAVPGVHFYGFRQIEENPVFYALADAFVLSSSLEEWGLVVNEAMASGLPVVVSETAGCAEDLLKPGWPALPDLVAADLHRRLVQLGGRIRQNGFVFDPKSVESLAGALVTLESVPALRWIMGKASRDIIQSFSCENFARNALQAARIALGEECIAPDSSSPASAPADFART